MPCSAQIISEMLPEIDTMEKFDFFQAYHSLENRLEKKSNFSIVSISGSISLII